jgi:hypothetical protein
LQKGETTQTPDADGLAADGVTVQLEPGTWSVTVDAFQSLDHDGNAETPTQEYKAATATASLTVEAGGSNSVAVQLEPLTGDDAPQGVFAWDITLPGGVDSAAMSLETVSALTGLDLTQQANRSGSAEVASGVYNMTIILGKDGLSTGLIEKVYIYGGLRTTAALDLSGVVFGAEVLIAGTLTVTGIGVPTSGYVVNAYASEADTNSESSPISTALIPSMQGGVGAFLLGLPVSDYNALGAGTASGKKVYLRVGYSSIEITVNSVVTVDNLPVSGATVAITQAAAPVITGQPVGASYFQNDTATALAITATASDDGVLTYQWYSSGANSNSGGTALTGETATSYTPPTTVAGTVYYYVVVTNTNNSVNVTKTATVTSGTVAIIVDVPGSLDITIGYNNGTITITGGDGANIISKTGAEPRSLTLSASGYTGVAWYVDGENKGASASLILNAADYTVKIHSVTFTGWWNGSYLSSDPIPFTVKY